MHPTKTLIPSALLLLALGAPATKAPAADAGLRGRVKSWRAAHERSIFDELKALIAIPNVASDTANIRRNAELLRKMLERRGIRAQLLEAPGSPPAVFGELPPKPGQRTLVLYAHYDGQPVTPSTWATGPWQPILRDKRLEDGGRELAPKKGALDPEWRLYGRSASDDKAPIIAMLTALDALKAAGASPSVNLKLFFEGEEEAGSPHLWEMLERHKDVLRADAWLICDGPVHQTGRKMVAFGHRGIQPAELTVYGPTRVLHSGHYGNWAPNPAIRLAHLLAGMRDEDGRVTIDGFDAHVAPLGPTERAALARIPDIDAELRGTLGLAASEAGNARIVERIMIPALNVRGLASGAVGATAANAIPTEARASIDFRLVPNQRPEEVQKLVESHLQKRGWFVLHQAPDLPTRLAHDKLVRIEWEAGYPASRTSMDLPISIAVIQALGEAADDPPVLLPSMGGSLAAYLFDEVLKAPPISLPIVNYDNNQHAANENIRLGHLWDGIEIFAVLMARLGALWR
jgi:acetylornithine deacetylase/succinyl-diaminopimelate desuccinylase-like protein